MIKILFLHTSFSDCAEYRVHSLLAKNANTEVITSYFIWQSDESSPTQEDAHNFYHDFGRSWTMLKSKSGIRKKLELGLKLPGSLFYLLQKIREIKPDVIYTSQQRNDLFLTSIISLLVRIPHILHLHYSPGPWLGKHAFQTLKKAKHVVAVSDFVRKMAIESGVSPAAIETLINPAAVSRFCIPKRNFLRKEFGWEPETPVIVTAARLDSGKGHELLLEAFARVHNEVPEARLLICGENSYGDGYDSFLIEKTRKLGLDQYVTFAGFRNDMPEIYADADIFCLPTENEPLGLVFVEAMAAGLPIVACQSGGVPEIVQHSRTGFLSEIGNAVALGDNLLKLLKDPVLSREMGEAGRKQAHAVFSADVVSRKWVKLIYRRLGNDSRPEAESVRRKIKENLSISI
jgi:glycosyltransferase involved in cell wall biosynthesis